LPKGEKMMTTQKLKALVNTVIKQSTLDSSQITDLTQKFSLTAGDKIEINDYKSADNNHWELELTTPVNEIAKWFAYIPHVEIKKWGFPLMDKTTVQKEFVLCTFLVREDKQIL